MRIREALGAKIMPETGSSERPAIVTVPPGTGVRELLAVLAEHNIGAVVVSSDGTGVDGIVSERDVVRRLTGHDEVLDTTVADIMTRDVLTVAPEDSLDGTRRMMTERRIRHLPVVDEGRLVGIVSIGDLVKSHIADVEFERDQLDSYVHQT